MHPAAPEGCSSDGAIRSHTVQRATALKSIAEDDHVLSGRDIRPGKTIRGGLERIGINTASTFRGFCSLHDNETFREIDTAKELTDWGAFLLGYRALAYELYMKMVSVPTLEMYKEHLDAGLPFEEQASIQQFIHGSLYTSKLGVREHSQHKRQWDAVLLSRELDGFRWAGLKLDRQLPIVSSGAYHPEFNFDCVRLQALDAPIDALSLLTFNIVPLGENTHAVFGWLDRKTQPITLIESLLAMDASFVSSALVQFCFDTSDNIFVKPSWWHELPNQIKLRLSSLLANSTPGDKDPLGLRLVSTDLFAAALVDIWKRW